MPDPVELLVSQGLTDPAVRGQLLGNAVVNYKAFVAVLLMASKMSGELPSTLLDCMLRGAGLDLHPSVRAVLDFTKQEMRVTGR
jgi:hypothetical protein